MKGVAFHGCCLLIVEAWALRHGCQKKHLRGRNNPSALSLTVTRRAKPPSPSPSITRRRTPAALAVGVHSF